MRVIAEKGKEDVKVRENMENEIKNFYFSC